MVNYLYRSVFLAVLNLSTDRSGHGSNETIREIFPWRGFAPNYSQLLPFFSSLWKVSICLIQSFVFRKFNHSMCFENIRDKAGLGEFYTKPEINLELYLGGLVTHSPNPKESRTALMKKEANKTRGSSVEVAKVQLQSSPPWSPSGRRKKGLP